MTSPAARMRLRLTDFAYGGEAFGRDDDGRVVFVPFGMASETVEIDVQDEHKRWARARLLSILDASPQRVVPRCQHFQMCGGCHYQHMAYETQLQAKTNIVRDQLQRLGGMDPTLVQDTIPCPEPWNYRSRLSLHLTPEGRLGFVTADGDRVFPLEACHLPTPAVDALWKNLDVTELEGVARVDVQSDDAGQNMIVFYADRPPEQELEIALETCVVWISPEGQWVLAGGEPLTFDVLNHSFQVSAGSFFQVNRLLTPKLVERAMAGLALSAGETVFDLYAGVGLFSLFAAAQGAAVVGVESAASACLDYEANLEIYDGVDLYEASVDEVLPAIDRRADAIIADPPRAGLGSRVVADIARLAPERFVYVSCDPATLARDARGLAEGGYELIECVPIDLFPQTFHIETVSTWRRT
jgi:23S rRNA (uracil1939-C5)-methyltransferase